MAKKIFSSILITYFIIQGTFGAFLSEKVYGQAPTQGYNARQAQEYQSARTQTYDQDANEKFNRQPLPVLPQRTSFPPGINGDEQFDRAYSEYATAIKQYREQANLNSAESDKLLNELNNIKATGCSINPLSFNLSACFQWVFRLIGNFILSIMGIVLFLAGMILNLVLDVTLVNMSTVIGNITGINAAWIAIRDVANMIFIFALLYIAISTILGTAGGATKKVLAHVIIAALLINFSLFFTKAIIDASNILAFGFYRNLPGIGTVGISTKVNELTTTGMSGSIMGSLKLQSIYDVSDASKHANAGEGAVAGIAELVNFISATIGGSIFILITAIVFLMTAVLFIIRFVILIILMILSPLAFAGMILPKMEHYSKEWWDTLWGQAIFAPALMMMIWITLKVAGGLKTIPQIKDGSGFLGVLSAQAGASFGIILNFLIIIIMLIASIIIANKISKQGSAGIMAYANKFQGFAGRNMVRYSGLRALDEKFGNTKFGNTAFGHTVREYSTGYATNEKWGGPKSAEEAHHEDTHLESERTEIDERNHYKKTLTSAYANPEKGTKKDENGKEILDKNGKPIPVLSDTQVTAIERAGAKIDPHSFVQMVKSMSKKQREQVSEHAGWGQLLAVWNEKEGELSKEEKIEILSSSRAQKIIDFQVNYGEAQIKYKEQVAEDSKKNGGKKAPDQPDTIPTMPTNFTLPTEVFENLKNKGYTKKQFDTMTEQQMYEAFHDVQGKIEPEGENS